MKDTPHNRQAMKAIFEKDHPALAAELLSDYRLHFDDEQAEEMLMYAISKDNSEAVDLMLNARVGEDKPEVMEKALAKAHDVDNERIIRQLIEADFAGIALSKTDEGEVGRTDFLEQRAKLDPLRKTDDLKRRLFKANQAGLTPLDHPRTWHDFTRIGKVLMEQKTPITKDEFFGHNREGQTWMEVAVRSRAFPQVLQHLSDQQTPLTLDDIRAEDGLLDLICAKGGAQELFSYDMLREGGIAGLRDLKADVPPETLSQVSLSEVTATLRAAAAHRGRGR